MVITVNKQYTKINNLDEFACALTQIREDTKKLKVEDLASRNEDINIKERIEYTIVALNALEKILIIFPKVINFNFGNVYIRFESVKNNIRKVSTIDINSSQIFLRSTKKDLESKCTIRDVFTMFDCSSDFNNWENKMSEWINRYVQDENGEF